MPKSGENQLFGRFEAQQIRKKEDAERKRRQQEAADNLERDKREVYPFCFSMSIQIGSTLKLFVCVSAARGCRAQPETGEAISQ